MPDIRPPHQQSPPVASPPPSSYGDVTRSWWKSLTRLQRNRLIGLGVLVVLIGGGLVAGHYNRSSGTTSNAPIVAANGTTSIGKGTVFAYNGITYTVQFAGVDLEGQSTQSATGMQIEYFFTIKSQPANLNRTPDTFYIDAAIPKAEAPDCGVSPTPIPADSLVQEINYFVPVPQKAGWCEWFQGLNDQSNSTASADDPNVPDYSPTPQEIQLNELNAPLNRTKVVLVIRPSSGGSQWIVPYPSN